MKEAECITSITPLKSPAEFTMICAPQIFFNLVSLQGLIQTDWKSSALEKFGLHKWLSSHPKQTRRWEFTGTCVYIIMSAYMHTHPPLKWLGISLENVSKLHIATRSQSTGRVLVWNACLFSWGAPGCVTFSFHHFQPVVWAVLRQESFKAQQGTAPGPVSGWVSLLTTKAFYKSLWCQLWY